MPREVSMQLQMQALDLKITDLEQFLLIPSSFVDGWFLVRGAISEYQESMGEDA